jgi:hypothetical protein
VHQVHLRAAGRILRSCIGPWLAVVPAVSTFQIRLVAVACWLLAIALAIPFLALYEQYSMYRDGPRVTGTVTESRDLGRGRKAVTVTYRDRDRDRDENMQRSVGADDPRFATGAKVELALHDRNGQPMLASKVDDERPTFLFVLGAVAMLALGVWVWMAPGRARRRRAAFTSPLDPIVDAARRTRNMSIALAIFLGAAAPFFAIVPVFDTGATTGVIVFIEVLAAISLALAVFLALRAYRMRDPRNNDLLDLIERRPHEIAWIYVHEVRVQYAGKTLSAHIWKTNGKLVAFSLVKEDADTIMAELARRAPHAARGYDVQTEKLYKQDPTRWQPRAA